MFFTFLVKATGNIFSLPPVTKAVIILNKQRIQQLRPECHTPAFFVTSAGLAPATDRLL